MHRSASLIAILLVLSAPVAIGALTKNLALGSRGAEVTELQTFLTSLGLLASEPTGYYGVLTQAAVQAYQRQNNIVSSGSPSTTGYGAVGPKTRNFIVQSRQGGGIDANGGAAETSETITVTSVPDTAEDSFDADLSAIDALLGQTAAEADPNAGGNDL